MSFIRTEIMAFAIDKNTLTHIESKSRYNHNYYHIDTSTYGDYIIPAKCDTIYEECDDYNNGAYYSLGWFEGDKFVAAWTWYEDEMLDLDISFSH